MTLCARLPGPGPGLGAESNGGGDAGRVRVVVSGENKDICLVVIIGAARHNGALPPARTTAKWGTHIGTAVH